MLIPAAVSARAAQLPWAVHCPLAWASSLNPQDPPPDRLGFAEVRIPAERASVERHELVFALLDGPGLSPSDQTCVESLLRRLKGLWAVVSVYPPRHIRFRRQAFDVARDPAAALAEARSGADLVWLQIAADSPLVGCPLGHLAAPSDPGTLALVRREILILSPDPTTCLQATDGVVLRGWR